MQQQQSCFNKSVCTRFNFYSMAEHDSREKAKDKKSNVHKMKIPHNACCNFSSSNENIMRKFAANFPENRFVHRVHYFCFGSCGFGGNLHFLRNLTKLLVTISCFSMHCVTPTKLVFSAPGCCAARRKI